MIRFASDYTEGAHPSILAALADTNYEQNPGYGEDPHCARAAGLIREACAFPDAAVHFLVGGTQANTIVIASVLKPYEGVLCADTGHIHVHETGSVEATGHKVLALPSHEGKITAQQILKAYESHIQDANFEHIVRPGMVYISHPTEYGTLYTLDELTAISEVCRQFELPLFLDGARLGYGLASPETDVTLRDIARLCDVFYIGGTKVGALFGEAVVITDPRLQTNFRYMMKRGGAMLAKGWLLGIQFEQLFEHGLYQKLGTHAVTLAFRIRDAFREKGIRFIMESPTNQQFPILTSAQRETLGREFAYSLWEKVDEDCSAVRFCTSWATKEGDVEKLITAIRSL
ncbi:MAG: aminotransferase class I/II-fold pyridoxal phosphate-dependent enzyme [Lachnospiraceae bacterium]|nr:aminotransferase class I/II-fold pyridoxal phosphate-dependent enzyme [Lachnospiraceae bacterium]